MTDTQDTRPRRYVATIHFVKDEHATDLATWTLTTWQDAHDWIVSRDIGEIIRPYVTATIVTEEQRQLDGVAADSIRTAPWWQPIEFDGYVISKALQGFGRGNSESIA